MDVNEIPCPVCQTLVPLSIETGVWTLKGNLVNSPSFGYRCGKCGECFTTTTSDTFSLMLIKHMAEQTQGSQSASEPPVTKITTTTPDRHLVEVFMGYPDLYLSRFVTWNDVIPVCLKMERPESVIRLEMNGVESVMPHIIACRRMKNGAIRFNLQETWNGVVEFIQWFNQNK